MPAYVVWLVAGLVLMIAETVAPGVFLIWLGLAAIGTGLIVLMAKPGLGGAVGVFAVLSVIGVALGRRARPRADLMINAPGSGLVGRTVTAIGFDGPDGRVRLGDSDWPARLVGAPGAAPGARLLVLAVDGTVLRVGPG